VQRAGMRRPTSCSRPDRPRGSTCEFEARATPRPGRGRPCA
jgi:hypothetical protein